MHNDYFWHDAYGDYPVVGVTWKQANAFANGEPYITMASEKVKASNL